MRTFPGNHTPAGSPHPRNRLLRDAPHGRTPPVVEALGVGLAHLCPPWTVHPDSVAAELGLERVRVESAELLVGQPVGQTERVVADTDGSQALGVPDDDDDLGMRLTAQVPQVQGYVLRCAGRCHVRSPSVGWGA